MVDIIIFLGGVSAFFIVAWVLINVIDFMTKPFIGDFENSNEEKDNGTEEENEGADREETR